MGEHNVEQQIDEKKSQASMRALLEDLRALEFMIETGRFETGVTRIGAEQEMFLIDRNLRPAAISLEVLDRAKDSRLTTEIARFNLEANLNSPASANFHSRTVGIVTSYDFLTPTASLFKQHLLAVAGSPEKEPKIYAASA